MDEQKIEKIRGYIDRTARPGSFSSAYDIGIEEMTAIFHLFDCSRSIVDNLLDIVPLAFYYGRAKGARSVRAEQRRDALT